MRDSKRKWKIDTVDKLLLKELLLPEVYAVCDIKNKNTKNETSTFFLLLCTEQLSSAGPSYSIFHLSSCELILIVLTALDVK